MLDGCKLVDVMAVRKYYDTAGMLSRTSPDSGAADRDSLNLTPALSHLTFLIVVLHITISRLIRKCADRTCFKCMPLPEDYLCILMGLGLIIT